MKEIDDVQLKLEVLKTESLLLPTLIGVENMGRDIETMEKYLRDLLTEYESRITTNSRIDELKKLMEFTGSTRSHAGDKRFLVNFWTPYRRILYKLNRAIINETE